MTELDLALYQASHPCPAPEPTAPAASERVPQLFVEAVLLDVPLHSGTQTRKDNLQQLAKRPDLRLLGSPHLFGKFDVLTTVTLAQHLGVLEQATLSQISLTPRPGESGQPVLELEFGFSLPNADPASNPQVRSAPVTLEAPYGQAALGFAKHPGDASRELIVIVTTRPVQNDDDLRVLFECKMRQRQGALEQP
ncbi:MAG TPA: hypothetical protein VJV79_38930 [Polyangiaceae bacterium]|nr:hypothetical protein [Polyangiaceae bacterium]